jgi:hypothetical protein
LADELGLDLDKKGPLELNDSHIIALNLFFKLKNHLKKKPDLLLGLQCPVELPKDEPEK